MKFKRKLLIIILLLLFFIPINIYAYSDKIILGGDNIGISVKTKEILVVGFYKVNNKYIAKESGFRIGDRITKVNNQDVSSIDELISEINKNNNNVTITIDRNNQEKNIKLKLVKENDTYKTGLFIKDQITGIGTLTYIDPNSKIYGSLGHEIADNKTGKIISIKDGYIFDSDVIGTIKSTNTSTGEKRAIFNEDDVKGTIEKNTYKGIFGKYDINFDNNKLIDVADKFELHTGKAEIYTVLKDNKVKAYEINILNINMDSDTKNIFFEITDKELINEANGVIKGMSGSPIVQNNKIVGAVTHAVLNDNKKGYGIFITTMLEEGEK
jgi:stage IV sporulation protein B